MERLPRGSNFKRAKMLWELGLNVAGNPATPYGGDRDMCITVGNGSGTSFRPALRMATGSPILAHDVANGHLEMAMVNPSGLLTQAYRGVGMFDKPLPLRAIGVYPTWDWFIFVVNPKTGIKSLWDIKKQQYPLHVSVKEDVTHSTRVMIDQVLGFYGYSLADIISWGGKLNVTGAPADPRRMTLLPDGKLDAIFDEGLAIWFNEACAMACARSRSSPSVSIIWPGSAGGAITPRSTSFRCSTRTMPPSITAAGRSTRTRTCPSNSPTMSPRPSQRGRMKSRGKRQDTRATSRRSLKTAMRPRSTFHCTRAPSAFTAS